MDAVTKAGAGIVVHFEIDCQIILTYSHFITFPATIAGRGLGKSRFTRYLIIMQNSGEKKLTYHPPNQLAIGKQNK